MPAITEARHLVQSLAAPVRVGDTIKAQISRASRRIPFWSYRRVKSVWYGETSSIDADHFEALKRLAKADQEANEARIEHDGIVERIERLEAALGLSLANMDRAQTDETGMGDC